MTFFFYKKFRNVVTFWAVRSQEVTEAAVRRRAARWEPRFTQVLWIVLCRLHALSLKPSTTKSRDSVFRWHLSDVSKQEVCCNHRKCEKDQRQRCRLAQHDAAVGQVEWGWLHGGGEHHQHEAVSLLMISGMPGVDRSCDWSIWNLFSVLRAISCCSTTLHGLHPLPHHSTWAEPPSCRTNVSNCRKSLTKWWSFKKLYLHLVSETKTKHWFRIQSIISHTHTQRAAPSVINNLSAESKSSHRPFKRKWEQLLLTTEQKLISIDLDWACDTD